MFKYKESIEVLHLQEFYKHKTTSKWYRSKDLKRNALMYKINVKFPRR